MTKFANCRLMCASMLNGQFIVLCVSDYSVKNRPNIDLNMGPFLPNNRKRIVLFDRSLVMAGGENGWDRFRTEPADPMRPGEKYQINVGIGMVAYVINRGHSIRVTVTGAHFLHHFHFQVPLD